MAAAGIRILLIEDDPGDERLMRTLLSGPSSAGFNVRSASRLKDALDLLKAEEFDAVLLDLQLPDSRGLKTIDRIRKAAPWLPAVVSTGSDDRRTAIKALKRGAQDFLVKGKTDAELLARTINHSIERQRAENRLAKTKRELEIIMENSPDANLVLLDRNFNFIMVNSAYAESCHRAKDFFPGKNLFALYPHAENEAIFRRARDSGEPVRMKEKPFDFPDMPWRGTTYWDWTLTPVKDGARQVHSLAFSLVDVTEKVEARRFSEILNDINIIIGSTLDFEQMISQAMRMATAALAAESSLVAVDDIAGRSNFCYTSGVNAGVHPGVQMTEDIAPVAMLAKTTGSLQAVPALRHDPRIRKRAVSRLGIRSAVAAPLTIKGEPVGAVEFRYGSRRTAFSQAQTDFVAKLMASFSLALENSRLYLKERELRAHLQGYTSQLSLLHGIGISLNKETDRNKLLGSLLDGAAEITGAGLGCMMLLAGGKPELISTYYASGFEQRCQQRGDFPGLHGRIERLLKTRQKNTLLFRGQDFVNDFFQFPDDHLSLSGLLVGILRDTLGRLRGYFMLSNKAEGAAFTRQDEEVVSLLAAQGSVALVSLENFEREHEVASTLQDALMPELLVRDDLDVGVYYESSSPISRLGGDFYDLIELGQRRLGVLVGDVCGKGLEAATSTAMIKYTVRAYLSAGSDPAACLTHVNNAVTSQIAMDKFVTCGLAVIDPVRRRIEYATAGHPPALLTRDYRAEFIDMQRTLPLGVTRGYRYAKKTAPFREHCPFVMYTDGLIEARPDDGEPFGRERLLAMVSSRCHLKAQHLADSLSGSVNEYCNGAIRDDICLLVVQLEPGAPAHSPRRGLPL